MCYLRRMELTTLNALALSAILSVAPHSEWVSGEDYPRLGRISEAIASAVHQEGCVFPGEVNCESNTIDALTGIAMHESGFAEDIQDCSRCRLGGPWCDHGKAISLYQMHSNNWEGHSRVEVCQDLTLASRLALRTLKRGRGSWRSKFITYAGRKESGLELYNQHLTLMFRHSKKEGQNGS